MKMKSKDFVSPSISPCNDCVAGPTRMSTTPQVPLDRCSCARLRRAETPVQVSPACRHWQCASQPNCAVPAESSDFQNSSGPLHPGESSSSSLIRSNAYRREFRCRTLARVSSSAPSEGKKRDSRYSSTTVHCFRSCPQSRTLATAMITRSGEARDLAYTRWSIALDKSITTVKQRGLSLQWASARAVHHC